MSEREERARRTGHTLGTACAMAWGFFVLLCGAAALLATCVWIGERVLDLVGLGR